MAFLYHPVSSLGPGAICVLSPLYPGPWASTWHRRDAQLFVEYVNLWTVCARCPGGRHGSPGKGTRFPGLTTPHAVQLLVASYFQTTEEARRLRHGGSCTHLLGPSCEPDPVPKPGFAGSQSSGEPVG